MIWYKHVCVYFEYTMVYWYSSVYSVYEYFVMRVLAAFVSHARK